MSNRIFLYILPGLLYFACKRSAIKGTDEADKNDTVKFFQVNEYLRGQIKQVNATPFFIYKIDILNNNKDSTPINTAIFNDFANEFLEPDINDQKIKHYYKENIFEDQTTKSFTISYSATNKELQLQNVEILLNEDGQTVKRVFLRRFYNYPDSSAIEQLTWKPGESFQINRSVEKPDNMGTSKQTLVVWNKKT